MAVPTSWYKGMHLLARLRAANVPQSDPAWCIVADHIWGPYIPGDIPVPSSIISDVSPAYEPIKAYRYCARCDAAQDYHGNMVSFEKDDA